MLAEHGSPEGILREHALDGNLDGSLGVLVQQLLEGDGLDSADVASVMVVNLVGELPPRDMNLLGVQHDDVIAHIHVRAVDSLVLALQAMSNLGGEAPERLIAGVDYEPMDRCRGAVDELAHVVDEAGSVGVK